MIRQDREDVFSDIPAIDWDKVKARGRSAVMQQCKVPSLPFCGPDGCDHCKESIRKHKLESIFKSLGE